MTNQEAIEILRDTPIDIRSTREDDIHTLYATAQGMAIEALQRGLENVNADSCSEKPNRSEPKTAESGSVEKEIPEIKSNRTTGGMIYRQDAIDGAEEIIKRDTSGNNVVVKAMEAWKAYINNLPSAQPVFSELCSAELTCEGCKYEKNGQDLCYECCRGCGDMYEERKDNG